MGLGFTAVSKQSPGLALLSFTDMDGDLLSILRDGGAYNEASS